MWSAFANATMSRSSAVGVEERGLCAVSLRGDEVTMAGNG